MGGGRGVRAGRRPRIGRRGRIRRRLRPRARLGVGARGRISYPERDESTGGGEQQDRPGAALATPLPILARGRRRRSIIALTQRVRIDRDVGHAPLAFRHREHPSQERGRAGLAPHSEEPGQKDQSSDDRGAHGERLSARIQPHDSRPEPIVQRVIPNQCPRSVRGRESLPGTSGPPRVEHHVRSGRADQAVPPAELEDPGVDGLGSEGVHSAPLPPAPPSSLQQPLYVSTLRVRCRPQARPDPIAGTLVELISTPWIPNFVGSVAERVIVSPPGRRVVRRPR